MRRTLLFCLSIALFVLGTGCPDNTGGEDTGPTPDTVADATGDTGGDTAEADADTGADADVDAGPAGCDYQSDCPEGQFCWEGSCREAETCPQRRSWSSCAYDFDQLEEGLGRRAWCDGEHCRLGCVLDKHCADGQICTDYGKCQPFEGDLSAPGPGGEERADLQAGIGESLMRFPVGLSQGGYGSRMASDDGRYVESLSATHGQMHGLYARAFLLDNGERQLLFIRLPIIFPTSQLHEALARRLQAKTGKNWRDSLMISGTHTHSGPARFYALPKESLLPLGRFGTDTYHDQAFQWLTESTFAAAEAALDDKAPAKFDADVVEDFDGEDRIASDRWGQTPQFDDNRLLLMRIDDLQGNPRGAAISYGTHGTIHSKDYFTGDGSAGVERGFEEVLAEEYGRYVPVMHFNQNGGTMSPRGDGRSHDGPQRFEKLGHDFGRAVLDDFKQLDPTRDVELGGVTYRFPITYDLVGYEKGEWGESTLDSTYEQYEYGGLQCSGDGDDDNDPSTHAEPEDLTCLPIHQIVYNRPPTLFVRSQMSAFQLGEITAVTAPGELSMELGWQMLRRLKADHGVDPLEAWTFGYAQDHQFYLMPTNLRGDKPPFPGWAGPKAPDEYADYSHSYLQGGYEPSMSFWGWKFGDFLVERASATVDRLKNDGVDRQLPEALPTQFSDYDSEPFPVEESDPETVGDVVTEPPETVERLEAVEFAWVGGDPGAEMPQAPRVRLQRKEQGSFSDLQTDRLRPYDNREPVMLTRMRRADGQFEWVVRWEELEDFPTGDYRFKVDGHFRDDGERTSYEATSRTFALAASDELAVTASASGSTVSGRVGYPAGQKLTYKDEEADPGRVTGNFRMRHPDVPTGQPAPLPESATKADVEVVVTDDNGMEVLRQPVDTLDRTDMQRGGKSGVPTTTYSADLSGLSAGTYTVTIEATDAWGNTGSGSVSLMR